MFDLETAITDWRRRTEMQWTGDKSALDELEDHLREEIAMLTRSGRGEQDAWTAAVAKLGDSVALRREFAKLDRLTTLDRVAFTTMLGVAAIIVVTSLAVLVARRQRLAEQPVLAIHIVTITFGYSAGLLAAACAGYDVFRTFIARRNIPALDGSSLKLIRASSIAAAAFLLIGFVFGAIWANAEWGKPFNMDPREIGALIVIACFVSASFVTRLSTVPTRISMSVVLVAGATVVAAWFGTVAYRGNFPLLLTAITVVGLAKLVGLAALSLKVQSKSAMR